MSSGLEPITPEQAKELYLGEYEEKRSYESVRKARSVLKTFVRWTDCAGIDNMNAVGGRQLQEMKMWWKEESNASKISLNGYLAVVRAFLDFCERIEAVAENTLDRMPQASIDDDEEVSDRKPSDQEVKKISAYLETHDRASRSHIEFSLMKELAIRLGAVRAIDKKDYDSEERKIELRHRPEEEYEGKGTPLKNGSDGERNINLPGHLCELIDEYLEHPERNGEGADKFARAPLLRNRNGGRPSTTTIRRDLYKVTRLCAYSNECPLDRDISECEATKDSIASECPVNYSPHLIRRWSIEEEERKRLRRQETLAATREGYESTNSESQMEPLAVRKWAQRGGTPDSTSSSSWHRGWRVGPRPAQP